ncbi:hypothetical protein INT46_000974 [Mucor plumbeus]|uniref:Uncharacterized protein n=1 Tax=Mucor plumbeus TaxID=97098 RepID=A0A8H7QIF8_9FUNG|nr:hypothetical protein INT46_000974 [Mucor plumbeus]
MPVRQHRPSSVPSTVLSISSIFSSSSTIKTPTNPPTPTCSKKSSLPTKAAESIRKDLQIQQEDEKSGRKFALQDEYGDIIANYQWVFT